MYPLTITIAVTDKSVAAFCFAGFVSYVHRMILSVLVDPLQQDLGIGDAQLSLLQGAAFALVYVFAGLPLGILADRKTRRNLVIIGSVIWTKGTMLCGLAPRFWTLFAARMLVGIPSTLSRKFEWEPDQIGGYFLAITTVTGIAGALLGGLLSDAAARRHGESSRFAVAAIALRQLAVLRHCNTLCPMKCVS